MTGSAWPMDFWILVRRLAERAEREGREVMPYSVHVRPAMASRVPGWLP
ncbi:hypothetical protein GCM10010977_22370 [Citricoccus zhacaiensis]|uniref:Uncharacterized protein n=1 Tax=Citricoccus zhacaiensis TaxID=489142 RepID=A0ABQ2M4E9_9MICC|nr:hypothetical protein GCM10010977_22370 [Citricoccus zhacaiensis]